MFILKTCDTYFLCKIYACLTLSIYVTEYDLSLSKTCQLILATYSWTRKTMIEIYFTTFQYSFGKTKPKYFVGMVSTMRTSFSFVLWSRLLVPFLNLSATSHDALRRRCLARAVTMRCTTYKLEVCTYHTVQWNGALWRYNRARRQIGEGCLDA